MAKRWLCAFNVCMLLYDTIDPFCLCGKNNIETSEHFLLHCPTYACLRRKLFDNLHNNNILLLPLEKSLIVQILLYGSDNYNLSMNKIIISTVIDFIQTLSRGYMELMEYYYWIKGSTKRLDWI